MKGTTESTCEVCGTKIEKKVFWKKYCSRECRLIAWAIRILIEKGYKITKPESK